ncbi:stage II sporulation protein R [Clostridium chrysemydis]|uniref:stage II sporulation protein R n=1 Tax=Clostridium chrysemydis TaxID=2665504 RepID=UPI00188399DB|nr:stage II sporulation protein R [Clostridium chrysemydis]
MKIKKSLFIILSLLLGSLLISCTSTEVKADNYIEYDYNNVKDEIIRFHVLANSDSKEDQELKLKVRDEVIKYLEPLLKNSKSIDESREILNKNNSKVINIANKVIKDNGYSYTVKTELKKENFPEKVYGNIILPQGEYEAYRILIEKAKGQNWWCVMFPPLCFVDVTKGEVAYEETEKRMEEALKNDGKKVVLEEGKEDIKMKFKVVEIFENIFSK